MTTSTLAAWARFSGISIQTSKENQMATNTSEIDAFILANERNYQPYWLSFCFAKNLNDPSDPDIGNPEFISWIIAKHSEFRAETGMMTWDRNYKTIFTTFLKERATEERGFLKI
jgi:hypothetical protein